MSKELWRDVKGFEGLYKISNKGNCFNMKKQRVKTFSKNAKGYHATTLYDNSGQYNRLAHRLVAESFIPNPENKPQVNHIDGDVDNNHVDNLEWVTNQENMDHANEMGLFDRAIKARRGEGNPSSKLKEKDVLWIRENHQGYEYEELGIMFGVTGRNISLIVNEKTWKNI